MSDHQREKLVDAGALEYDHETNQVSRIHGGNDAYRITRRGIELLRETGR